MQITRDTLLKEIAEIKSVQAQALGQYNACVGGIETLERLLQQLEWKEPTEDPSGTNFDDDQELVGLMDGPILARD